MSTFLILTKTSWNEPKRIRHQLVDLLLEHNHTVIFVEKGSFKLNLTKLVEVKKKLFLFHPFTLLHHQLRFLPPIMLISSFFYYQEIKKLLKGFKIDYIINFNYDSGLLLRKFRLNSITIVNDNFVVKAKSFSRKSIEKELIKTFKASNSVFSVSLPLVEVSKPYNKNSELFLPWIPRLNNNQFIRISDKILYYGFINNRVNWHRVFYLLEKGIEIDFYGPIEGKSTLKTLINLKERYKNFQFFPPTTLDKINAENYCCSIQPYNSSIKNMEYVTLSNRTLQLLAYGLPVLHEYLPNLIDAPKNLIYKCRSNHDYFLGYHYFKEDKKENFSNSADSFLLAHTSEIRYKQLMAALSN